jgi:hypothetical protein
MENQESSPNHIAKYQSARQRQGAAPKTVNES